MALRYFTIVWYFGTELESPKIPWLGIFKANQTPWEESFIDVVGKRWREHNGPLDITTEYYVKMSAPSTRRYRANILYLFINFTSVEIMSQIHKRRKFSFQSGKSTMNCSRACSHNSSVMVSTSSNLFLLKLRPQWLMLASRRLYTRSHSSPSIGLAQSKPAHPGSRSDRTLVTVSLSRMRLL